MLSAEPASTLTHPKHTLPTTVLCCSSLQASPRDSSLPDCLCPTKLQEELILNCGACTGVWPGMERPLHSHGLLIVSGVEERGGRRAPHAVRHPAGAQPGLVAPLLQAARDRASPWPTSLVRPPGPAAPCSMHSPSAHQPVSPSARQAPCSSNVHLIMLLLCSLSCSQSAGGIQHALAVLQASST